MRGSGGAVAAVAGGVFAAAAAAEAPAHGGEEAHCFFDLLDMVGCVCLRCDASSLVVVMVVKMSKDSSRRKGEDRE